MTNNKGKKPDSSARSTRAGSQGADKNTTVAVQVGQTGARAARSVFSSVCKLLLTIFLVTTIIVCIVGTAMTVLVMRYIETEGLNLNNVAIMSNTYIYGLNSDGEYEVMQRLTSGGRQEWISIDDIPQHVQDAFVYTEDQRFNENAGVDWRRTMASFVRMLIAGDSSQGGGSTISQQLIKNLNGDIYDRRIDVKIKEIIGALQLERHNSKSSILEAYLNVIDLGNGNKGVQAASKYYFNKDVSELTYAEAASLAATTKSPSNLNIANSPDDNKERRNYVTLKKMWEFDAITDAEYEEAKKENIEVVDRVGEDALVDDGENGTYNWYVEEVIEQVKEDLIEQYGYIDTEAYSVINGGGLRIYTNCDIELQEYYESYFLNDKNFYSYDIEPYAPNGGMLMADYDGYAIASVGSRYEKEKNLISGTVTANRRSSGSTMKPITTYALAIDTNLVHWSSMNYADEPKFSKSGSEGDDWPQNYSREYSRKGTTIEYALRTSLNTIPAQLISNQYGLGIDTCYEFLEDTLHLSDLDPTEDRVLGLTLGMMNDGITLSDLTAAYIMFGNDGMYNSIKYYTEVVDINDKVVLEKLPENQYAIDSGSAYVMNKMLQNAVTEDGGTGRGAKLDGIETAGKSGTSDDNRELTFVGLTPDFILSVRFGYDQNDAKVTGSARNLDGKLNRSPDIWHDIASYAIDSSSTAAFEMDDSNVVETHYCTYTGLRATSGCYSRELGYYKADNVPVYCTGNHS